MATIPIDEAKRQLAELRGTVRALREQCEAGDDALRRVERQNAALKAENDDLKGKISAVLGGQYPPGIMTALDALSAIVEGVEHGVWLSPREAYLAFLAFDAVAPRTPNNAALLEKLRAAAAPCLAEDVA